MARLQFAANTPDNSEALDDYSPIPAGDVIAHITKSQYKKTKAGDGNYLQLIWKVVAGKYKGRTLFDNLNLDNPNPIAVEIANKTLNSICKACDKVGVQDSEELHGIPCKLTLSVQPKTTTNPASNNIKGYAKADLNDVQVDESPGTAQTQQATPQANAAATPAKKLPWETDTDDDPPF